MSFLVSEVQRIYPEYDCGGVLVWERFRWHCSCFDLEGPYEISVGSAAGGAGGVDPGRKTPLYPRAAWKRLYGIVAALSQPDLAGDRRAEGGREHRGKYLLPLLWHFSGHVPPGSHRLSGAAGKPDKFEPAYAGPERYPKGHDKGRLR